MEEVTDFRSARQIHDLLSARGHRMGLATVYRNLHAMEQRGECDVLRAEGSETAVFRRCERRAHHHHLVCRGCGTAVEVRGPEIERWAGAIAGASGFSEVTHTVEMFGTCRPCQESGAVIPPRRR
jgi:Fur family ferric uptake transcriptional regulator